MTAGLLPLVALWLWNRQGAAAPPAPPVPSVPQWPTPTSPPLPAFKSTATPHSAAPAHPTVPKSVPHSADPGHSSTPLADLHNAPPKVAPPTAFQPEALKAQAKSKAMNALRGKLRAAAGTPTSSVAVSKVQSILSAHGLSVSNDGLYGPKTAAAWSKLAAAKHLPTVINRGGPNIDKVATQTYEALQLPAIP